MWSRLKNFLWGVVFLCGSGAVVACSVNQYENDDAFAAHAVETNAVVVSQRGFEWDRRGKRNQVLVYFHELKYDGHRAEKFPLDQQKLEPGAKIRVLYRKDDPQVVALYSDAALSPGKPWTWWAWALGGTLFLLLASAGCFISAFERDRHRGAESLPASPRQRAT